MSRKKLIRALDKSKHNFKDITLKKLNRIAEMQNLSQDEFEQIAKMNNLPQNKLEQITKKRGIKNIYKYVKRRVLISILKSGQSIAEPRKSNNNAETKEITEKFNILRNNLKKKKKRKEKNRRN